MFHETREQIQCRLASVNPLDRDAGSKRIWVGREIKFRIQILKSSTRISGIKSIPVTVHGGP
jgi:hypothetical protein